MKLLSNITLHEDRLGTHNAYFMTHVETIDFLVVPSSLKPPLASALSSAPLSSDSN